MRGPQGGRLMPVVPPFGGWRVYGPYRNGSQFVICIRKVRYGTERISMGMRRYQASIAAGRILPRGSR